MRTPGLIVFDCDGTLVDSQFMIIDAMAKAFAAENLPPPNDNAVRRVVGLALMEAVAQLVPEESPAVIARLTEHYKQAFRTAREAGGHEPLYPGARETVRALDAAGYLLGVATGKSRRGLLAVLELHGLRDCFVTLQTADDAPGKPHPAMLQQAMAEAGADAAETVMVGDTSYDILMARAARTAAVGVTWGYHAPEDLAAAGAVHVIDRFDLLPGLADRLLSREVSA